MRQMNERVIIGNTNEGCPSRFVAVWEWVFKIMCCACHSYGLRLWYYISIQVIGRICKLLEILIVIKNYWTLTEISVDFQ